MTNPSPNAEKSWLHAIRRDWDARARENARAYINWPDVPDEEDAFFGSGKTDYDLYVTPFLQKMSFDPRKKTALEIGCGIGRIARWMSQDFAQYIGVDVSPEMIQQSFQLRFAARAISSCFRGRPRGHPKRQRGFRLVLRRVPARPRQARHLQLFSGSRPRATLRRNFSSAHERLVDAAAWPPNARSRIPRPLPRSQ